MSCIFFFPSSHAHTSFRFNETMSIVLFNPEYEPPRCDFCDYEETSDDEMGNFFECAQCLQVCYACQNNCIKKDGRIKVCGDCRAAKQEK